MPNWCNNSLVLKHNDPEMLERAAKAFNEGRLLQEFIPVPKDLIETTAGYLGATDEQKELEAKEEYNLKTYGHKNWYDFSCAEWGTKWDIGNDGSDVKPEGNELHLNFESAWSPPVEAYRKLDELGFDVLAYYFEPGCAFCGKYSSEYDEETYEIEGNAKWVDENIPEDINVAMGIGDCMAEWEDENEEEVNE